MEGLELLLGTWDWLKNESWWLNVSTKRICHWSFSNAKGLSYTTNIYLLMCGSGTSTWTLEGLATIPMWMFGPTTSFVSCPTSLMSNKLDSSMI